MTALDPDTFDQLRDTVRRFVRQRLQPLEARVEEENTVPEEVIAEMRALGLAGLTIPTDYGGLGLSSWEEAQIVIELTWVSPAFRSVFGSNMGIGAQGIVIDGTEAQKQAFLPRLASGELIGSFCLTEPEAGSDAASLKTAAVRDGDTFVVNGTKRYITNAPRAGIFTLMARSRPEVPGAAGISAFLVDASLPGISLGKTDKKMGQRGTQTCDVIFDDVRVPASAIIGGEANEGQGFKTAMRVLDRGRIHIAAMCVGAARRLIWEATEYAENRRQFGKPIADFQLVQAMLADSAAEAYAGECMMLDTARRFDAGENIALEASAAKMFCSEMVGRVADRAVQIFGGAGYMAEYPIERFFRDVRLFRIYEGTTQIQQLVIARELRRRHVSS